MKLEVLHVPDCPNLPPLLDRLAQVTDLPVTTRVIESDADAIRFGMSGSPTLLVNGIDPFAAEEPCECGVSCRLYRDETGRIVPAPSLEQLRDALGQAAVLSTWRARAIPLDPVEKSVHQAILRTFATTGHPPELGRSTADVLTALHDIDAIRLAPDGQILLAYPFSATPTRHRVRIAHQVDVYAMCAIDALGISPMLNQDTLIESTDATTNHPITITTTNTHTHWNPASAVVFLGAHPSGGPSVDSCCNYLNFFTNPTTAQAWLHSHPQIPGHLLTPTDAEALATQLFQPLLAPHQ